LLDIIETKLIKHWFIFLLAERFPDKHEQITSGFLMKHAKERLTRWHQ